MSNKEAPPEKQIGFIELLRENREFRRLWLGQIVSQTGDWFNTIALFQIALHLTDSGRGVALILTTRFLATVIFSPLGGVLADRFNRRTIMIAADLFRVVIVLGFLFVRKPEDVWLIYVLTVLQLAVSAFFEPARSAALPSVVEMKDLVTANAITAATWSTILTLGAAFGGLITAWLGTNSAFIIDSLTYLLSAILIYGLRLPKAAERPKQKITLARITGIADVYEGLSYVWQRPRTFAVLMVKPAWGIAGGTLALLAVLGEKVFPVAGSGAIGISVLYIVRGLGTATGPILFRNFVASTSENMETAIGYSILVGGAFFAFFGLTNFYPLALVFLFVGYMGGSVTWLNSSVLLQTQVEDDFRGRVFATEIALLTLTLAASNYVTGELLDSFGFEPQTVAVGLGIAAAIPGVIWFATRNLWRGETREFNFQTKLHETDN